MKQKDLALIGVIVFISAIVSLFISKAIFSTPQTKQQQVDVVQPINSTFIKPDSSFFNNTDFDPAQPITITQNNNTDPFSGSGSATQ